MFVHEEGLKAFRKLDNIIILYFSTLGIGLG